MSQAATVLAAPLSRRNAMLANIAHPRVSQSRKVIARLASIAQEALEVLYLEA